MTISAYKRQLFHELLDGGRVYDQPPPQYGAVLVKKGGARQRLRWNEWVFFTRNGFVEQVHDRWVISDWGRIWFAR